MIHIYSILTVNRKVQIKKKLNIKSFSVILNKTCPTKNCVCRNKHIYRYTFMHTHTHTHIYSYRLMYICA